MQLLGHFSTKGRHQSHCYLLLSFPTSAGPVNLTCFFASNLGGVGLASHASQWKYNTNVKEYFVETETKQTIKASELRRKQEICDMGEPFKQ